MQKALLLSAALVVNALAFGEMADNDLILPQIKPQPKESLSLPLSKTPVSAQSERKTSSFNELLSDSSDDMPSGYSQTGPKFNAQDVGIHVSGSLIYWRNMLQNLEYAIRRKPANNQPGPTDTGNLTLLGTIQIVKFDYDPGFKIETGYKFGLTDWDLLAECTYLRDKGKSEVNRFPTGIVYPFDYIKGLFFDPFGASVYQAKSNVSMDYGTLDVSLERPFFTSQTLFMNAFFGGRGSWISQDWHTIYNNNNFVAEPFEKVYNDWTFKGGGLRMGFDVNWDWGYGFGFHFLGSASAILGHYTYYFAVLQQDTDDPFLSKSTFPFANIEKKDQRVIPSYQLMMGLNYRYVVADKVGIGLFADWEFNGWTNLHQVYPYPATTYYGPNTYSSVVLQGLTIGAEIDF